MITPYLGQPGTQMYVEGFEAAAKAKGWEVNTIDTAGDVAAVISRIEDAVTQKVDAIVINVDPPEDVINEWDIIGTRFTSVERALPVRIAMLSSLKGADVTGNVGFRCVRPASGDTR